MDHAERLALIDHISALLIQHHDTPCADILSQLVHANMTLGPSQVPATPVKGQPEPTQQWAGSGFYAYVNMVVDSCNLQTLGKNHEAV